MGRGDGAGARRGRGDASETPGGGRPATARHPLPGLEWIARHVRHAIAIGGEACIGLGGDLDGISFMPAGIDGVEDYPLIPEALAAAGLTESQIEKVCWRNMARVFGEVLG